MWYKSCDLFINDTKYFTHSERISLRVNPCTTNEDYNLRAVPRKVRYEYYIGQLIVKLCDWGYEYSKTTQKYL